MWYKDNNGLAIVIGIVLVFAGAIVFAKSVLTTLTIYLGVFLIFCGIGLAVVAIIYIVTTEVLYSDEDDEDRSVNENELMKKVDELEGNYKEGLLSDEEYKKRKNELYEFFS